MNEVVKRNCLLPDAVCRWIMALLVAASLGGQALAQSAAPGAAAPASKVPDASATASEGAPNPFNFPTVVDIGAGKVEYISGGAVVSGYGGHRSIQGPLQQGAFCGYSGKGAVDAEGNMFFADHADNQVWAFLDGRIRILAGTGARGFRDNCPAGQAQFDIIAYTLHTACVVGLPGKGKGCVLVVDNKRVRRIQLKDGHWWVDTLAGGGKERLKPGEKKLGTEIALAPDNAVACDPSRPGTVFVVEPWGGDSGLVRITLEDGMAEKLVTTKGLHGQGLQLDQSGRMFGWARELSFTRLDKPDGKLVTLAVDNPPNVKEIMKEMEQKYGKGYCRDGGWDGPGDKVDWYCPSSWAINSAGTALYAGGGDAWNVRRIKDGYVKTLFANGEYHVRQAMNEKTNPVWQVGSPCASAGEGIYLRSGPYEGANSIIRYTPGTNTEVEGE
jgi:hypothetical protein